MAGLLQFRKLVLKLFHGICLSRHVAGPGRFLCLLGVLKEEVAEARELFMLTLMMTAVVREVFTGSLVCGYTEMPLPPGGNIWNYTPSDESKTYFLSLYTTATQNHSCWVLALA